MARQLFDVDGLRISNQADAVGVVYLFGTGAPGGDTSYQDNAAMGSVYSDKTSGHVYHKKTAGSGADKWERLATIQDVFDIAWRKERVIAVTADALAAGVLDFDTDPFSDDAAPALDATDFAVNDYILSGYGGTEKLFYVSAKDEVENTITLVEETLNPLADNDMFIVRYFLPDGVDAQEKQAILHYNGTDLIKIADFNWALATGINLSGAYAASSGDVAANDTVEVAIQKLDGVNDNQDTLLGRPQGSTHLSTFTGKIITDDSSVRTALQELETAVEGQYSQAAVTAITTVDSIPVDDWQVAMWEVSISLDSAPATKEEYSIKAMHNGHAGADATAVDDSGAFGRLKFGAGVAHTISFDLNGAGAAQVMRLRVSAAAAVTVKAKRVGLVASV